MDNNEHSGLQYPEVFKSKLPPDSKQPIGKFYAAAGQRPKLDQRAHAIPGEWHIYLVITSSVLGEASNAVITTWQGVAGVSQIHMDLFRNGNRLEFDTKCADSWAAHGRTIEAMNNLCSNLEELGYRAVSDPSLL